MSRTLAANRVLATHRQLATARALNGVFTPLTDPNLQALYLSDGPKWQNTPRTTPATANNDPVFVWDDAGPFARHLTAGSSLRRPLVQLASQGGLPGLLFDGSLSFMKSAAAADFKFLSDGSPWSIFALVRTTTTEPDRSQTLFDNNNGASANRGLNARLADAAASSFGDNFGVFISKGSIVAFAGSVSGTNGAFPSGGTHLLELIFDPSVGLDVYVDGWFIGRTLIAIALNDGTPSLLFTVGVNASSLAQAFGGQYYALAMTREAVNPQRRVQWEAYFKSKYSLLDLATFRVTRRDSISGGVGDPLSHNYAAFPGLTRTADGELLALYKRGSTHFDNTSVLVQRKTSGAGAVWGAETSWYDTANRSDSSSSVSKLASGRLVAVFTVENALDTVTPPARQTYTRYSDDNGATWSAPVLLNASGGVGNWDQWLAHAGRPIELTAGGDILLPTFGQKQSALPTPANYDVVVYKSTDHGATYSQLSAISDAVHGWQFEEPQLGLLDDGRVMMLVRVDGDHSIRRCWSSDNGATWTALNWVFPGFAWPAWVQLSTGTIICLTRHYDASYAVDITQPYNYTCYRLSRTRGETWEAEVPLVRHFELYHDLVDLGGGKAGIINFYGVDGSSSATIGEYIEVAPTV